MPTGKSQKISVRASPGSPWIGWEFSILKKEMIPFCVKRFLRKIKFCLVIFHGIQIWTKVQQKYWGFTGFPQIIDKVLLIP